MSVHPMIRPIDHMAKHVLLQSSFFNHPFPPQPSANLLVMEPSELGKSEHIKLLRLVDFADGWLVDDAPFFGGGVELQEGSIDALKTVDHFPHQRSLGQRWNRTASA